jgi:hypothetical protein
MSPHIPSRDYPIRDDAAPRFFSPRNSMITDPFSRSGTPTGGFSGIRWFEVAQGAIVAPPATMRNGNRADTALWNG